MKKKIVVYFVGALAVVLLGSLLLTAVPHQWEVVHQGTAQCVAEQALKAHLAHGDALLGPCP